MAWWSALNSRKEVLVPRGRVQIHPTHPRCAMLREIDEMWLMASLRKTIEMVAEEGGG